MEGFTVVSVVSYVGLGPSGAAFFVNGLPAPDLYLVRGRAYTFVVETGAAHPFYITSDADGGFGAKADSDRETVFAGVHVDREGAASASGVGRLCVWTSSFASFAASFASNADGLDLHCPTDDGDDGNGGAKPGVFTFTPNEAMPDTIYYQVRLGAFLTHAWRSNALYHNGGTGTASDRPSCNLQWLT